MRIRFGGINLHIYTFLCFIFIRGYQEIVTSSVLLFEFAVSATCTDIQIKHLRNEQIFQFCSIHIGLSNKK